MNLINNLKGKTMKALLGAIVGIILFVAIIAGIIALFQYAWNYVAPLFQAPNLTFWQTAAVLVILLIIGSFFKATQNKN